jgi:hypothetical protein
MRALGAFSVETNRGIRKEIEMRDVGKAAAHQAREERRSIGAGETTAKVRERNHGVANHALSRLS